MQGIHIWTRVGAFLAIAALGAACSGSSTAPKTPTEADRAFIDGIVPHHGMATLMAEMAIMRSTRVEIRTLAATMKADQDREVAQLKSWKKQWFGTDSVPTPMMPRDMPAGPDFDLEWMKDMITHHQGAMDMSTLELRADGTAQSDSMATHIIAEQRQEQQQLRAWAKQWYGVTLVVGEQPQR